MDESKKDDVGTTGDGLGEGVTSEAKGPNHSAGGERSNSGINVESNAAARSEGSIASGGGDEDLTQASGGSVD